MLYKLIAKWNNRGTY